MSASKPPLRMFHNLARSGGTLISKCLGCMDGVVLLSEIHPYACHVSDPLKQAAEWHHLLVQSDVDDLMKTRGTIKFLDAIDLINKRAVAREDVLVIRDWAHLDYTGYPYNTQPSYQSFLYEELKDHFDILRFTIVRDPVDQWLSFSQLPTLRPFMDTGEFSLERYLAGNLKFAKLAVETGFIRYEDFVSAPGAVMREICGRLKITFDPEFVNKWSTYTKVSGDLVASRGNVNSVIRELPRRALSTELREALLANKDYLESIKMLGYDSV